MHYLRLRRRALLCSRCSRIRRAGFEAGQNTRPVLFQRLGQPPVAYGGAFSPGQDHEVNCRPVAGETPAKTFPDHALDPIAADRSPVHLARHGHAESRAAATVRAREHFEPAITRYHGFVEDALEFGWLAKTGFTRECGARGRSAGGVAGPVLAHSTVPRRSADAGEPGRNTASIIRLTGAFCPWRGAP